MNSVALKIAMLLSLLTFLPNIVNAGGAGPGGGDPYTQQFMNLAHKLSVYLKENPNNLTIPFSVDEFSKKVQLLDESIKDEGIPDKIEFTDKILHDRDGVEKPAIFSAVTNSIHVNRKAWRSFTKTEKLAQIIMEVSGLLNSQLRYETAVDLVANRAEIISNIILRDAEKFDIPGWRVAGEDRTQFSQLTEKSILIDAGILGQGDSSLQTLKFLKNPNSQQLWSEKIWKAWVNIDKAFFMVASPSYDRVILSVLYVGQEGDGTLNTKAYSLQFEKSRTVYSGACADPGKLSSLDRIKTCFLDLNYYYPTDNLVSSRLGHVNTGASYEDAINSLQNLMSSLEVSIIYFFAKNEATILEALRENFIVDYSRTIIPSRLGGHLVAFQAAPLANGLIPNLVGPFDKSPFWIKSPEAPSEKVVKLYRATQFLAENGLVFADYNIRCPGTGKGSRIIEKSKLDLKQCMWTAMYGDFEGEFYNAMEQISSYDETQRKWIKR